MHTFLTPEPITIEIRNASGQIRVDLADVASTTVDVVASSSHPLGFLDDVIRAAKTQFADRKSYDGSRSRFGPSFGGNTDTIQDDPAERVRVDLRQPPHTDDVDSRVPATLIVDTDPARDGWKTSFIVHVTAPESSGIRIQSQSADVIVTGPAERLEARTASGDVRVDQVAGRSVVQTASGDVSINGTAECDVRTASGDIEVHRVTAEAVLHSTSGDVRIDVASGDVNARSVSGDIRVLDVTTGRAEVITVSGDVEIGIHAGSLTAVDLSTVSGTTETDFTVTDDLPTAAAAAEAADAAEVTNEEGPVLELRVKTTSGDIRLRRSLAV
jgi:Putative adhesin